MLLLIRLIFLRLQPFSTEGVYSMLMYHVINVYNPSNYTANPWGVESTYTPKETLT
ncbi:hypothetical protein MNBD_CHLOROFLEXI01-2849 [hydrothermal vent metagenome]|uniref:Uncharacterized protein n=1 Tax=hydrothermal vent metagenome TaxID=652676 RepID=A0A3B0VKG7_9ZZZZ